MPLIVAAAGLAAGDPAYELHEWGVFHVAPDAAWTNADLIEEWASFPDFFIRASGQPPGRPPMVARKPAIFLRADHATREFDLDLSARMPGGRPLVWWPSAAADGDALHWRLRVLPGRKPPAMPPVPAGHWIAALRDAGGDGVIARIAAAAEGARRSLPPPLPSQDRFIYYDGVLPPLPAPRLHALERRSGGPLWRVELPAGDAVHDLIVADRRDGTLRLALAPGRHAGGGAIELTPAVAADLGAAWTALRAGAADAGLDAGAGGALQAAWGERLCGPGITIVYRLGQAAYDRLLPLHAVPAPSRAVRIGLAVFPHREPDLAADLHRLIAGLAEPDRRAAAQEALAAYAAAAAGPLAELAAGRWPAALGRTDAPPPEVSRWAESRLAAMRPPESPTPPGPGR